MLWKCLKRTASAIICLILFSTFLLAMLVNETADVYSAYNLEESGTCIIIDPGHGGIDGGAVSCTGVYESHINLQIALRLNDLMKLLGHNTKLIRSEDISIYKSGNTIAAKKISDLKERVKIINETNNAILISIHQNSFQDSRYCGAQVFYANNSQDFAKKVQALFVNTINTGSNRKAKRASGIYLMEHLTCPGILVECGFLSSPVEEERLRDQNYQKKICCIIACGTAQYINALALA